MASCDVSTLLSGDPFARLSDGEKLSAEVRLIQIWANNTETLSQILARAGGFLKLSPGECVVAEAQLLSVISGQTDPNAILANSRFIRLDDGLRWDAKLARLRQLAASTGSINTLMLNNSFTEADMGLVWAAKLRLLCDIAFGAGLGSAQSVMTNNRFMDLSLGLVSCCINEMLCGSSSGIPDDVQTVTTQTGTSATENISLGSGYDSVRVWTGETPVTEPWFFLYVTRSGVTTKIKMNRFEARLISVPGKTVGFATADGRSLKIAPDVSPTSLGTSFPVSGTANCDAGGPPIWSPSAAHITLASGQFQYELVGSGTERIVFVSEYDGATWSPARWLRLPASGSVRMHATFSRIALANYDGATVSVNGPTGTVIGGTSASSSLTMPSVTGTTHSVTDVASLKTAIAAAVAGDEIVLAAGTYNLDVNITAASFTSNNGVGGRVGMEGITIRGATSDRTLYVIGVSGGAGDWNILGQDIVRLSGFRDLTFSFGSTSANFAVSGGKWSFQNCAFTGSTGTNFSAFATNGTTQVDVLKCNSSNSGADCFDYYNANSSSYCRLINCTGSVSGNVANGQVITAHNAATHLLVYGGEFADSHTNVVASDGSARISLFFSKVDTGAVRGNGNIQGANAFACWNARPTGQNNWANSGMANQFVLASRIRNLFTETTSSFDLAIEGNLCKSESGVNPPVGYYPNNVVSTVRYERNVLDGYTSVALRFNFGTTGSMAARSNTVVNSAVACDISTSTSTKTIVGNVSRSSGTRGITSTAGGMATTTVNYNIWDKTPSASYVAGANDITGVDADLDANYLPSAAGNCDGTGNPAAIDWVGGTDYVGFLLEISDVVRDRGARCRPRIISGAIMVPDIW